MEIHGYKAFHYPMLNRYGKEFEENKTYTIPGELKFGNNGNGFHFCKRLEDTLRYVPGMEEEISIAKVTSFGEILERNDEYNGYFEMYCTNQLRIDKVLTREEIIKSNFLLLEERVIRLFKDFYLLQKRLNYLKYDIKNVQEYWMLFPIIKKIRKMFIKKNTLLKESNFFYIMVME